MTDFHTAQIKMDKTLKNVIKYGKEPVSIRYHALRKFKNEYNGFYTFFDVRGRKRSETCCAVNRLRSSCLSYFHFALLSFGLFRR